jgi:hypothetical protein
MATTRQQKCWATHVGGCSEKSSREHLVSRALLPNLTVVVEGFDWCKEPRSIGVDALTRRILCTRHNSELSPADEAIAQFSIIANEPKVGIAISGRLLERWFLKTLVNLSIGTKDHIGEGMAESEPGWPPPYLAAVVFGSVPLRHKMGLYTLSCREPYQSRQGEILFVPLTRDRRIGGALFGVAGMYFFLSLNPGFAPTTIGDMAPNSALPSHVRDAVMVHRPIWLEFADKHGNTARIDIDWATA